MLNDINIIKEQARATANLFRDMGYSVVSSYGHDHGLTEWDILTQDGELAGSVLYDGFGVTVKGDQLQSP